MFALKLQQELDNEYRNSRKKEKNSSYKYHKSASRRPMLNFIDEIDNQDNFQQIPPSVQQNIFDDISRSNRNLRTNNLETAFRFFNNGVIVNDF